MTNSTNMETEGEILQTKSGDHILLPIGGTHCSDQILLLKLIIFAGVAGYPQIVQFRNFPAHVRQQLWSYFAMCLERSDVYRVFQSGDANRLAKLTPCPKLVLVPERRLLTKVAWRIGLSPTSHWKPIPCQGENDAPTPYRLAVGPSAPVIFAEATDDDLPLPTIVVDYPSMKEIQRCLVVGAPKEKLLIPTELPQNMTYDSGLTSVLFPEQSDLHSSRSRRVEQLWTLLIGACMLRVGGDNASNATAQISLKDYDSVYHLLQSVPLPFSENPVSPLAVAMVNRINVYRKQIGAERDKRRRDKGQITRRELTDLGNTEGKTIQHLLSFLLKEGSEFSQFRVLGVKRHLNDWPSQDPKQLAKFLLPWSYKQVRDHFHPLEKTGLISSERSAENQPYRYTVPESLESGSFFQQLPTLEKLRGDRTEDPLS